MVELKDFNALVSDFDNNYNENITILINYYRYKIVVNIPSSHEFIPRSYKQGYSSIIKIEGRVLNAQYVGSKEQGKSTEEFSMHKFLGLNKTTFNKILMNIRIREIDFNKFPYMEIGLKRYTSASKSYVKIEDIKIIDKIEYLAKLTAKLTANPGVAKLTAKRVGKGKDRKVGESQGKDRKVGESSR